MWGSSRVQACRNVTGATVHSCLGELLQLSQRARSKKRSIQLTYGCHVQSYPYFGGVYYRHATPRHLLPLLKSKVHGLTRHERTTDELLESYMWGSCVCSPSMLLGSHGSWIRCPSRCSRGWNFGEGRGAVRLFPTYSRLLHSQASAFLLCIT
jgi:hypothetical protein